jgi:hypothetical protein
MDAERQRQATILRYWHAVEMFSPQTVPPVNRRERIRALEPGKLAPWEDGHYAKDERPERDHVWQHVVYGGVYDLAVVKDRLIEVFGADPDADDERMSGESAMFAFTVNEEGRVLLDTPIFSTCAWALGRTRDPGPGTPDWLAGFDDEAVRLAITVADLGVPDEPDRPRTDPLARVVDAAASGAAGAAGQAASAVAAATLGPLGGVVAERLATSATDWALNSALKAAAGGDDEPVGDDDKGDERDPDEDDAPRLGDYPLTGEHVLAFAVALAEAWGVDDLGALEVRVKTVQVPRKSAGDADQQDFLNSFCLSDLSLVGEAVRSTAPGRALEAYLTPAARIDRSARTDVRQDTSAVDDGVLPASTPVGRWPARADHPLVLSQQFAVNAMRRELADGGLFSVNGPPGTGKTTMLRDVIADVVVQRAQRLAQLPSPAAAFRTTALRWTTGTHTRRVWPLKPELCGFEVVVASANNGAVENVSKSIPARDEIAEEWRASADYLAEHATRMLKGAPGWAALAAVLGKTSNRSEFVHRFWWGDEQAGDLQPDGTKRPRIPRKRWQQTKNGFYHQLAAWGREVDKPSWAEVRHQFTTVLRRVEELTRSRDEAARALRGLPGMRRGAEVAVHRHTKCLDAVESSKSELSGLRAAYTAARQAEDDYLDRLERHRKTQPGLFSSRAAKQSWRHREEILSTELTAATTHRVAVGDRHAECELRHQHLVKAEHAVGELARSLTQRVKRLTATVEAARRAWPGHMPDLDWDEDTRELSAPWADTQISQARAELFLAALELHKQFLRLAADKMRDNLHAAMAVVNGNAPPQLSGEKAVAAWRSLFLVVPVVSTTFASLDRMFRPFDRESLGWLFIDEAGQATPQQAVGALWRARRAVIVGDPLQLEPVTVLPWTGQEALRIDHGVDPEWAAKATSAQRVADRTNRFGTMLPAELPDGSHEVWVGAPLRVHRRCDNPMFTVSNTIAYDNMMVFGTPPSTFPGPRPPRTTPDPPPSLWANVVSSESEGHWVPAETEVLVRILDGLHDSGIAPQQIFVISPFRQAVAGALRTVRQKGRERGWSLASEDRIGTVHKTQGKESDVVILLLGSDPRRDGARRWAAGERPNLINVAVSRAKRRLYVIGDRDCWSKQKHTATLASALECWNVTDQRRPESTLANRLSIGSAD